MRSYIVSVIVAITLLGGTAMAQTNQSGSYTNMLRWRQADDAVESRRARIVQIEAEIKRLREELRKLVEGK